MEQWFTENWTENIRFSVRIKAKIHSEKTPFQQLDFYDSYELGRFFTLDGIMMANEKDEYVYHEMIVHTPMSVNPAIKSVLIIGGGDGGSVRELTKYPTIETIDLVEIDERVVITCEQYFKVTASKLRDPRVHLLFTDGAKYVQTTKKTYDLIIVDSTDPIGPGEGLFSHAFYQNCKRLLNHNGILVNQHESPYFENTAREMQRAHQKIKSLFPIAKVYQAFIPTYPSGHWLFGFASNTLDPITQFHPNVQEDHHIQTRYYNGELHKAAFVLPNDVKESLQNALK